MSAVTGRGVIKMVIILRQNKGRKQGYAEVGELLFCGLCLILLRGV